MTSLPTAPALNAFLLGYPVAYSVGDREEAALASRALRSGGGSEASTLALVTLTARALSLPLFFSSFGRFRSGEAVLFLDPPASLGGAEDEKDRRRRRRKRTTTRKKRAKKGEKKKGGNRDAFVSLWVESVRASAVGKNNSQTTSSPLACLFRGEGLEASVEFVDSGGVTM